MAEKASEGLELGLSTVGKAISTLSRTLGTLAYPWGFSKAGAGSLPKAAVVTVCVLVEVNVVLMVLVVVTVWVVTVPTVFQLAGLQLKGTVREAGPRGSDVRHPHLSPREV